MGIPIIFSAPMVKALLAGRKTMTRRMAWVDQWRCACGWRGSAAKLKSTPAGGRACPRPSCGGTGGLEMKTLPSPWQRVKPGDRLWVREAWRVSYDWDGWSETLDRTLRPSDITPGSAVEYLADDDFAAPELNGKDRRSFHMPRWASRLTLVATAIKVERLQAISNEDARNEGVDCWPDIVAGRRDPFPAERFRDLWNSLHGADAWDANIEIVALTFTVHQQNIDRLVQEAA